ncbi:hypothetical protein GZ78_28820 [Endozoicomonas numazuensis]|uniref:Uncharacterized protein n=1 Tax=Endozoicomonas numazuensis TaxID=1137799 RepID=A0A081MZB9_9GAMM|nr:hypothetical protein GZ78_28820 [Endozoicomonas numazuensis]
MLLTHPEDDIAGQFQLDVPGLRWEGLADSSKFYPLRVGFGGAFFRGVEFALPVIEGSEAKSFGSAKLGLAHVAALLLRDEFLPLFFGQSFYCLGHGELL